MIKKILSEYACNEKSYLVGPPLLEYVTNTFSASSMIALIDTFCIGLLFDATLFSKKDVNSADVLSVNHSLSDLYAIKLF